MRSSTTLSVLVLLAVAHGADAAPDAKVNMSLAEWREMMEAIESEDVESPALPIARVDRRVEGVFSKGLFSGTLVERFEVLDEGGHVRVPVIDGEVSLGAVSLNGKRTSLLKEDSMYTVGVDQPGTYEIALEFFWGEDQDRFARKLLLRFPEGGVTRFAVSVPETDIDARLALGALIAEEQRGTSTSLVGNLDSSGVLDLSWTRRPTHKGDLTARMEARVDALFTVQESLLGGRAVIDFTLLEGETDVVEIALPAGIEVVKVEGEAVLQWRTDARKGDRLTVLLRYLVSDRVRVTVHFQAPCDAGAPIQLALPLPLPEIPMTGTAGVQGPPGLEISVASREGASMLTAHELPERLTEMTTSPILFGFAFDAPPRLSVSVARNAQVVMTSTVVEELQASTVLAEDGAEVTKIKIRIRNNTREHMSITLPKGAILTHAMVDGQPVRPALSDPEDRLGLLFPLRRSERVTAGGVRLHTVREGETLSDIANFYYSDPSKWSEIVNANPQTLSSAHSVAAGQRIEVPSTRGVSIEESTFIIELAYKAARAPLGLAGRREVSLPTLDVDTMRATWHLYLPEVVEPMSFRANLTQYSSIRYDPFRRLREFVNQAMWVKNAWAGGKYENILSQRKTIYMNEAAGQDAGRAIRAAFPLVGEQYRFKRILLGKETPTIELIYVDDAFAEAARWIALGAAFLLATLVLGPRRRAWKWIVAACGLALLLVLGHYFLGTYRRIIWGVDLALVLALLRLGGPATWRRIKETVNAPWRIADLVGPRNLAFLLGLAGAIAFALAYPLFVSSTALVVLSLMLWMSARKARKEATRLPTSTAILILLSFSFAAPAARAQGETMTAEENAARQAWADNNFEAIMMPQNEAFELSKRAPAQALTPTASPDAPGLFAPSSFGQPAAPSPPAASGCAAPCTPAPWSASTVELPLATYDELRAKVAEIEERAAKRLGPVVSLGSSEYTGRAVKGALALRLTLQVTLGHPGAWKTVPLVGDDVVLVEGRVDGREMRLSRSNGYHVWVTDRAGEATIDLELLVPARGPRGSLEYDFLVAKTPVTRFSCSFPVKGLEPRLDAAVQSEVVPEADGTRLEATLKPTTRIHLVGFKDLGEEEEQTARVFAETSSLLSVAEKALEVFSVVRYTILYSGARQFDVRIPAGMTVVFADGEGAFRYSVEDVPGEGSVLRGETAYPMRNTYEVSLRLERKLDGEGVDVVSFEAPLPRCLGVEREHGWLAIEVPGKLRLTERARREALAIDVRQLPPEMIASAVSPITKAYRYHSPTAAVSLDAAVLPDMEPSFGSIDRIRAFSVVSSEGKIITDMRMTMRNRLRPTLSLDVPKDVSIRSVHLDGEAISPSRDERGGLVLPLKRSEGRDLLRPFTLQVVMESSSTPLGLFGSSKLVLPAAELPASSTTWTVFLPANNLYSALHGDVETQTYATEAVWHQPANLAAPLRLGLADPTEQEVLGDAGGQLAESGQGHMAVRIELPKSGTRLDYARYWLEGGVPLEVSFRHVRSWLSIPAGILLALVLALAVVLAGTRLSNTKRQVAPAIGLCLGACAIWPLWKLGGEWAVAAGLAAGMAVVGARRRWLARVPAALVEWARTFGERSRAFFDGKPPTPTGAIVAKSIIGGVMAAGAFVLFALCVRLAELLTNPL